MSDTDTESGALARLQDDPTSRKRFLRMVGGAGATGALGLLHRRVRRRRQDDAGRDDHDRRQRAGRERERPQERPGDRQLRADARVPRGRLLRAGRDSGQIKDRAVADLAKRIAETERPHVEALKATAKNLGGTPAAMPTTKFDDVSPPARRRSCRPRPSSRTSAPRPTSARPGGSRARRSSPPRSRSTASRRAMRPRSTARRPRLQGRRRSKARSPTAPSPRR